MDITRDFVRQIDKAESGDQANFFTWLATDSRKIDQFTPLSRDLGERRNFRDRRVRIGRRGQLGGEKQPRHAHRLIDKDLLLIFVALAPFQNIFEGDHRGLELQDRLKKKGELQR